jgi:cyclic pyranopterin phosphate synthase
MNDHYNREINYLRVSVTDRCNLRCTYCMPKEGVSVVGHYDILRYEEILRVVRTAMGVGVVKVRVTGGEPLVRRGVLKFIASLKSIEGLQDVSLTTNGVLLEPMAEDIFRAGLRRINVSLDSLNPEKYREVTRGGSLDSVLGGIEEAHRVGFFPIKINIVSIKGVNENEILDFARLTLSKPYQVRFIELMPFGGKGPDYENRYLSGETVLKEIEKAYSLEPLTAKRTRFDGPARLYRITDAPGEIGFISAVSQHFCRSCNRLRLTADGHLRACLFSEREVDLKGPMREGCSDEDLVRLINQAVEMKPQGLKETGAGAHLKKCSREMSAIGG